MTPSVLMTKRATTLEDVHKTLSPKPLLNQKELRAFYRDEVNEVRGGDAIARPVLGLQRAYGANFYKAFLMGHSGVGKSTELTRLALRVGEQYQVIRFSATNDLDPASFKPFDVLLLMIAEVAERTAQPEKEGGAGKKPSDRRLEEIWNWFATDKETLTEAEHVAIELAAGAGVSPDSWWAKALGLFASIRGDAKYAADRKKEVVQYRLVRLSRLIELTNSVLDECNQLLKTVANKEWLFIGEDFDKTDISVDLVEALFVTYANVFKDLRTHLMFTIPIDLVYSQHAARLPLTCHCIPDTPVYSRDHHPDDRGRKAVQAVVEARVSPALFEDNQMTRLIVASGGNLRDLFFMVSHAADTALLRGASRIGADDASRAIREMRTDYARRLGQGRFDRDKVGYDEKADRLTKIYKGDPNAGIPDPILHTLLRARAVQEFNDQRWFGLHPLVVDILKSQGKLKADAPGGTDEN